MSKRDLLTFGREVRRARTLQGWTLDQLVSKVGSGNKSFLSNIENGKRPNLSRRTVSRLIAALAPHLDAGWFDHFGDSDDITDAPTPEEAAAEELVERVEADTTAPQLGESLLITLAYEFAGNRNRTVDDAYRGLRGALEAAKRIIDRGTLPSNLDAAVQEVLAEVARRVAAQDLDGAAAATERELARLQDEVAKVSLAQMKLHDTAIDLARSRNLPEEAAAHVLARIRLEGPEDLFEALQRTFIQWYERGRDRGLSFDLEVAIRLARDCQAFARTADERGSAQSDLGMALQVLGQRETGTARLEEAVVAYRRALKEWRREDVPLNWAMVQSNLGNALAALGERETGTARLEEAVVAFRLALEERRREIVPLDWAATQNNLGAALAAIGERETRTARLAEAVETYRLALKEQRREEVPLNWARTQNNLGTALGELAAREKDPERFAEALAAYDLALREQRREVLPMNWAETAANIAATELGLFDLTADPTLPQQALERLLAAREVFEQASPYHLAKCDRAIARARSLL